MSSSWWQGEPPTGTRPRRRAPPRDLEHQEQVAFFERCALYIGTYPELALLYAIPNGGKRGKATAARLKAEGVRAGVPDVHLPVPRYSDDGVCVAVGLWLEFKIKPNRPTDRQLAWISALRRHGHSVSVVASSEEAWTRTRQYLGPREGRTS